MNGSVIYAENFDGFELTGSDFTIDYDLGFPNSQIDGGIFLQSSRANSYVYLDRILIQNAEVKGDGGN